VSQAHLTLRFNLLTFSIVFAALAVVYVVAFRWLDRRHALASLAKTVVSRFAPGLLIIAPPIITYGFVCGALSFGFSFACLKVFSGQIPDPESFFRPIFKGFEYFSGVGCGYFWLRFAAWLGLRWPWYLFILASHVLVAGYREARFDYGGAMMGPTVTEHFVLSDALVPLLALVPYYLFHARKNAA
jgi:hypothetical protein